MWMHNGEKKRESNTVLTKTLRCHHTAAFQLHPDYKRAVRMQIECC